MEQNKCNSVKSEWFQITNECLLLEEREESYSFSKQYSIMADSVYHNPTTVQLGELESNWNDTRTEFIMKWFEQMINSHWNWSKIGRNYSELHFQINYQL